jgi:biofilm PGA synthesis N-glycosyltransferase PgaC
MQMFLPLALWVFICLALLIIHFLRFHRLRKALRNSIMEDIEPDNTPMSIIIAARNEAHNLQEFLPFILKQDYPNFEVLVVNDGSTDNTELLLAEMTKEFKHLRVFNRPGEGKKKAISFAIAEAHHERLLFTDADCFPASLGWAKKMSSGLQEHDLVLAHGGLIGPKSFVSGLSIFETFQTATSYFSAALAHKPYMGVGRNMAYNKRVFELSQGFENHQSLLSGDDDLFVASLENINVKVQFDEAAFTYSDAPSNMEQWWLQKRRHYSASFKYPLLRKLSLGLEGLLQLFFYLLLPVVLMLAAKQVFFIFFIRYLLMLYWVKPIAIHFKAWQEWLVFPLWELSWSLLTTLIHLQNLIFGARKTW